MAKTKKGGLTGPQRAKVKKAAKLAGEVLEILEGLDDGKAAELDLPDDDETPAERRKRLRAERKSGAKDENEDEDEDDDPTLDDVREILTKVIEEFDNKEAEILLKDFKAKRASDLDEKDYTKFITACQEALDE